MGGMIRIALAIAAWLAFISAPAAAQQISPFERHAQAAEQFAQRLRAEGAPPLLTDTRTDAVRILTDQDHLLRDIRATPDNVLALIQAAQRTQQAVQAYVGIDLSAGMPQGQRMAALISNGITYQDEVTAMTVLSVDLTAMTIPLILEMMRNRGIRTDSASVQQDVALRRRGSVHLITGAIVAAGDQRIRLANRLAMLVVVDRNAQAMISILPLETRRSLRAQLAPSLAMMSPTARARIGHLIPALQSTGVCRPMHLVTPRSCMAP